MPPLRDPSAPLDAPDAPDEPPDVLAERSRAWHATGDPRALWPGLDPRALQPAADAIGRAAAAILRGERGSLGASDGRDARALGIAALVSGMGPMLGHWIERGVLDASDPVAAVLARHLAHGRRRMERIARDVVPGLRALVDAGITPAIIKGFHTAHVYFPEPGLRPIADVDVVVTPDEFDRAAGPLGTAGFTGASGEMPLRKREWFPPDDDGRLRSLELWHARGRWSLELHDGYHFHEMPRYRVRPELVAGFGGSWAVGGVPVRVAAQPLLIVTLATHLSGELYSSRLLRLVELVLLVRRDRELGVLDWGGVADLLDRSGATRFAHPAFALVERLAPGTIDGAVLARTRRAASLLARRVSDRVTPTAPILEERVSIAQRMMWASGPADTMLRAIQMVAPIPHPGVGWGSTVRAYHRRVRRLLAGRVSWRVWRADGSRGARREPPDESSPSPASDA
jgi:hypothetical protein